MSEEAEKAAKWDMCQDLRQQLKAARSRLAILRGKTLKIGKDLQAFGLVLQNPSWTFKVDESEVHGKSTVPSDFEGITVPLSSLDATTISGLLREIPETEQTIQALKAKLRELDG